VEAENIQTGKSNITALLIPVVAKDSEGKKRSASFNSF
jgi:hypothetical protein